MSARIRIAFSKLQPRPDVNPIDPTSGLGSLALRNTVLVLAAKVVARLIALFTVIATLNHLGAARYGAFITTFNFTAIVSVALDLGFNVLFVREGARHRGQIQRYLRNVMSARLLGAVASLAILAAALELAHLGSLLAPAFALMLFTSYAALLRNALYAVQRLEYEALGVVLESVVLLALTLIGVHTGRDTTYFVWAYAGQYLFSCIYFSVALALARIATIGWAFETSLLRKWLWQGLPFALTFVLTTLYFRLDQPMVFTIRSASEAGWYGAAYKPIEALLFVPTTLLSIVFPVLSIYHHTRPESQLLAVSRLFKALLLLGWPLTVALFVLAGPLTQALRLFPQSEPAFRVLALALGLAFVNNAFIGALSASDRQSSFTWAAGWSLVANILCNILLIPTFGYVGASWSAVITELVLGFTGWVLTARYVGRVDVLVLSWRTILAGLVMGIALLPFQQAIGLKVAIPIFLGSAVYAVSVIAFGAVNSDELAFARKALAFNRGGGAS